MHDAKCVTNGGLGTTYLSQIPFTIDGCDNIGFAFTALPDNDPIIMRLFFIRTSDI